MEKQIKILVDHKEYITKEEAYKAINEQYHVTGFDGYQDGIELMNHIAKIPAADVVEVVRCKDCKYRIVNEHYEKKDIYESKPCVSWIPEILLNWAGALKMTIGFVRMEREKTEGSNGGIYC